MKASEGDRITIAGGGPHEPLRDGEIIEVPHPDGTPPYLVRWSDTGRQSLIFPGPDARIVHYEHHGAPAAQPGTSTAAPLTRSAARSPRARPASSSG
ncbi:hypothetical protein GCM10023085_20500 [Actinomadura viridis]|uniref:DUF1918 domain-containing protein n=1 Tax=Actinomadura viridis TaxID=58110 RepID=A0A931GJ14_9ACTN|nr:DUF1918 domain-containing protein [Actinomadura viridis]MBG6089193.1 hypothetical protein [Actinomadura viridis]